MFKFNSQGIPDNVLALYATSNITRDKWCLEDQFCNRICGDHQQYYGPCPYGDTQLEHRPLLYRGYLIAWRDTVHY